MSGSGYLESSIMERSLMMEKVVVINCIQCTEQDGVQTAGETERAASS
jgi:hypothetical protein